MRAHIGRCDAGVKRQNISLTYQRIEMTDLDTNGSAMDDWESVAG